MPPSYRQLQQWALAISVASIIYNGLEGAIAIGFGAESSSHSLMFFGIQSTIEVVSAVMVVWRFSNVAKPGEERGAVLDPRSLRIEKLSSLVIAALLILLSISTETISIAGLFLHFEPETSLSSLVIASVSLVGMIAIWLPKRYLAKALDSSAMRGETTCSLSCIQMNIVLLCGSLIRIVWKEGWWVDSATSIVLGIFFMREGVELLRWAMNPNFNGGCCDECQSLLHEESGESHKDLCRCCADKPACREAGECKCVATEDQSEACCTPRAMNGSPCCTHKVVARTSCCGSSYGACANEGPSTNCGSGGQCSDFCC